ncbi:hypothetical protein SCP_1000640 [Sparassis crispa]|uniref:ER membrane protein complex subunit 1 n=1 Tax=Sparassis crispa TaxID=139825 RepID=A0A401GXB0_9APHY|nr:hypothetical protein SCP_1000640 [Sparassis crispa]GBE86822.1 hypothetical protein SCP_1000640 [Sparassis crispa]
MRFLSLWLAASCISSVWALHASEVGVVDWYKSFAGVPRIGAISTAPVFHRIGGSNGSTQSLVLTATEKNVLAAISPVDGSLAWRYLFDQDEHVIGLKAHQDVVAAVSGSGGATLRLFDALTGDLRVEKRLHRPDAGRLFEPETLGTAIAFEKDDVFVLSNGHILRRVDSKTGELKWCWASPDEASLVVYSKIIATPSVTYVVGLAKSFASYTLHVTTLSSSTGELLESMSIPSSIKDGLVDFLVLSTAGQSELTPHAIWFEDGSIRVLKLTPEIKETSSTSKGAVYKRVVDVGLSEHGQFVALKDDGTAHIFKLTEDGLKAVWEFRDSASSNQYAESHYVGGLDKDGWPFIARVYWSHVFKKATAHVFAAHLADGKGFSTSFTFPFETSVHGVMTHVALDAANPEEFKVISRLVLTTSTGAVQLWQQDQLHWTREEALSDIRVAEFVELPERKIIAALGREEEETFMARLVRQTSEAQDFPQYAINFVKRFVTGSYASVSSSVASPTNASEPLSRDTFGLRKIIVVATPYGKVYGIDSANGEIVWSRVFGLGWAAEVGGHILPVKLFVTRTVSDGDSPQVVLITQRRASNTLVDTVLFHIDALTGADVRGVSPAGALLQGLDVIAGPLVEAYLLRSGNSKIVVLLDEFVQVHLYPDTSESTAVYKKALPSLYFVLRTGPRGSQRLTGHQISSVEELMGRDVAYPTWTVSLPPSEVIYSIIPKPHEPVASLGKVLGNRTTLYKYLNPNLVAVVTGSSSPPSASTCSVYLVDGAKGTIIYHATLPSMVDSCDIHVALTENWLVYDYYDGELGVDQAKSHRIVSVELYEGSGVDDKRRSSDASSFSDESADVTIFEQSYVLPRGITTISATSTSYGISMKDIIVANENHQIQSFPRRFLDPRRPKQKPTNQEMEEWLTQYEPLIPDDPKRVLSHNYEVAQTKRIITSPALLESTSLVFAYGLDLFFTRVAPSSTFDVLSENFNKAQLVFTVGGLALAIIVAKPMVSRKRLRERWYD